MSTPPKKSGPGCLKIGLYIFVGLIAISILGQMFGDSESQQPATGGKFPPTDSLAIAKMDSTNRAKAIQDSIAKSESTAKAKKLLAGLKSSKDEFEETTFYYGGVIPYNNVNRLYLYMPYQDGFLPSLRMKVQYAGEDWIFWNEAEVKVDDKKMSLLGMGTLKRDNNGGKVWETTDSRIDRDLMDDVNNLAVIRAISASKSTTLRLSGKYRKESDAGNTSSL
jgi:hypothetical protein